MEELILRVLDGKATRFEEERLKQWRDEDPGNEAQFQALARLWKHTEEPPLPTPSEEELDRLTDSIAEEAEARRVAATRKAAPNRQTSEPRTSLRRAAPWALALAAGLAAVTFGIRALNPGSTPGTSPPVSIALSAQTLRLDDGSFVRVAPGSHLEARLEPGLREVVLEGRAFFAVAPDPDRRFLVRTRTGEVSVLGTRFEVSETEAGVRTVVVEGRVALANESGAVDVPAGSLGLAREGHVPTAEAVDDVLSLLNWPGGLLVFHDTPLSAAAREVERHFGLPIRIEGGDSVARRVSASFEEGESFQEVVETLCAVTRASCRITPDSAIMGEER